MNRLLRLRIPPGTRHVWGTLCLVVVAVGAYGLYTSRQTDGGAPANGGPGVARTAAPADAPAEAAAPPRADSAGALPVETAPASDPTKVQDRIAPILPAPPALPGVLKTAAPYDIVDPRTFTSGDWTITLRGVEGAERDAICHSRERRLFACGLMARAALNNALQKNAVTCEPREMLGRDRLVADCKAGSGDLALLLVRSGWLKPASGGGGEMEAARKKAEAEQIGMWNGGWTIR
jgi:endonuclease YncB( thermonuclease family)